MGGWRRRGAAVKRGDPLRAAVRQGRRLLPAPDGELALRPGGGPTAREVLAPDLHAEAAAALDLVLDALADLAPVLAPAVAGRPARLAVREADRERLGAALGRLPAWMEITGSPARSRRLAVRPLLAVDSRLLPPHPELGVEIDVMGVESRGAQDMVHVGRALGAPDRIAEAAWEETSQESLQPRRRRPAPPAPDVEIDVVLTWVDGTDAAWRARRDAALRALGPSAGPSAEPDGAPSSAPLAAPSAGPDGALAAAPPHPSALDESRFVEADELRHSLRSIHRYANWVRRIHLVTDDQVPPWLDVDHPRIHLVSHRELIGGSRFNSHALEASLHRIPGLAEHYLYLNDDVLLGDIAHPGDFFAAPGISRFFPSDLPIDPGPSTAQDRPIMAAAKNGRDLISERFGLEVRTRMRHTVHPQLRSIAERIEQEHPEQVARTREAAFRSRTDLSLAASLHHWYAHALGRAVSAEPDYLYVDLAAPGAAQTLDALESLRRYDSFCLNQEEESPDAAMRRELARFLHRYFPHPAPWELPEGPDGPSDSVP